MILKQERLNRAIDAEDKIRLQKELAIAKRQGKVKSNEEKSNGNIAEDKTGFCFFFGFLVFKIYISS